MATWNYPETIEGAASILDAAKPEWRTKINVSKLDMSRDDYCILGQLYGHWKNGIDKLFGTSYSVGRNLAHDNIFGTYANQKEWIKMIQNEINDWNWVRLRLTEGKKVRQSNWPQGDFIFVKDDLICTNVGQPYYFAIHIFDAVNWEILPEWTLESIPVGMKFKVKFGTPSIKTEYIYQKINPPSGYNNFVCFINTYKGIFHSESNNYANTIEVVPFV